MRILITTMMLLLVHVLHAQYNAPENRVWAFGMRAGINFNSGTPVPFSTKINSSNACASTCDSAGQLLFYTDGNTIWNRYHDTMPSAVSIVSYNANQCPQGTLILPHLTQPGKYYVFSLERRSSGAPTVGRLSYCIVDMALDGGRGDVVAGSSYTFADTGMWGAMTAVPGNAHNFWLINHLRDTNVFVVRNITAAGFSAPAYHKIGVYDNSHCVHSAGIKCSPDRTLLAYTHPCGNIIAAKTGFELFRFNPGDGSISDALAFDTVSCFGIEFSPDGSKLYVGDFYLYEHIVQQFDVSVPTYAAITASRHIFPSVSGYTVIRDMKVGPDGKMYLAGKGAGTGSGTGFSGYIDCIEHPNASGAAAGYTVNKVVFTMGGVLRESFPNVTYNLSATNGVSQAEYPKAFRVSPNPAGNTLFIDGGRPVRSLEVTNVAGSKVIGLAADNIRSVDISSLATGVYFATINSEVVEKFVKE